MPSTFLDIIKACDSWDPNQSVSEKAAVPLHIAGSHVGHIPTFVLSKLLEIVEGPGDEGAGFSLIYCVPDAPTEKPWLESVEFDGDDELGFLKRTKVMDGLLRFWRAEDAFECLRGWREERYPVYGDPRKAYHEGLSWDGVGPKPTTERPLPKNMIMTLERSGAELFGIRTFGAHLTGYVTTPSGELKIWVAKRSETKQTYPGMLDNMVAGGIPCDQTPREAIVRECGEEAGVPEEMASKVKAVGAITYNIKSRLGGLCPEAQFIYDLELPSDFIPKPEDGEVAGFKLCGVDEVIEDVKAGKYKPNCAVITIDFLIRHGIITPENEPDYLEITSRLHNPAALHGPAYS